MADKNKEKSRDDNKYCCLIVGNGYTKSFVCLKETLINASEVFKTMFNGNFKESQVDQQIELPDVEPIVFNAFLKYLEDGSCGIAKSKTFTVLKNLLYFCEKYLLEDFQEDVISILKDRVAQLHDDKTRKQDALLILCAVDAVNQMNKFDEIEFFCISQFNADICPFSVLTAPFIYNMSMEGFTKIIKEFPGITLFNRFRMVELYIKINLSTRSNENLLKWQKLHNLIDFTKFSLTEFLDGIETSEFVDMQSKYEILLEIVRISNQIMYIE